MRVLGLDPSLTDFGWSLHGTSDFRGGRFQTSAKTLFVDRYLDLRERVRTLVREQGVNRVGVEYPVFGASSSSQLYGLFLYTCEALRQERCDVVFFSPGQGKAQARDVLDRPAGWKMGKIDMVEAAKLDSGIRGSLNHNVADAYWIARTASRFWQLHDGLISAADLTDTEKHQFRLIHTYTRGKKAGTVALRGLLWRENERFFCWSRPDAETTPTE